MLSRRLVRIKVLQALYTYFQTGDNDLPAAEKQLIRNINRIYELYIYLLSFFIEVHELYASKAEEARHKFLPTQDDLHPNTRFIENRVALQIANNRDFKKKRQQYKINWADEAEMIRLVYQEIKGSQEYLDYLNAPTNSYEEDRNFLMQIVRNFLYPSLSLQSFFEEKNIHWADDYDIAMMMLVSTIRSYKAGHDEFTLLPDLYGNKEEEAEHQTFAYDLFRKTIIYSNEFAALISSKAENWELDRIALMDIIMLKMAITEFVYMPSIPVKVTLNEYIEISKQYSTPKSKIFINGILDKLIGELKESKKMLKTGRGLIEN